MTTYPDPERSVERETETREVEIEREFEPADDSQDSPDDASPEEE